MFSFITKIYILAYIVFMISGTVYLVQANDQFDPMPEDTYFDIILEEDKNCRELQEFTDIRVILCTPKEIHEENLNRYPSNDDTTIRKND